MSFEKNMGFSKNPFSKKSSEQELDFLEDIFFEPNYYKTLMDVLSSGDSRFIIGQRGHGKSSIINKLLDDLERKNLFVIKIDRFDSVPIKRNETALLKLILSTLITKISIHLKSNRKSLKKLDPVQKEKLALFIRIFFVTLSNIEYSKIYNKIQKVKVRNFFVRFFNKFLSKPANSIASTAISITSTMINQSLGLQETRSISVYQEYFGHLTEIEFGKINFEKEEYSKEKLKQILDEVLLIIDKMGFENTVVLFDKIDEYQDLNQDISRIANFTIEILSDTELLLNDRFAIGFSLWSELKSELSGSVRFDKFGTIDVRWGSNDLTPLINKRLKYFSIDGRATLERIVENENDQIELIKVANKSPRDLISALSEIYQVQANTDSETNKFDSSCITNGLINFCSSYDYDSITPSKSGKNKEIKAMINRILKMRLTRFTTKQLTDTYNQNSSQSDGQIKLMIQYKLIREDDILGHNNEKYFEVIDPKVEFLIRRGVTQIE